MFAYPSGHAHVGHVRNYMIGDVLARMKRMRGYNVLQPFGWDAFGMPAENAAIKNKTHPEKWTRENIAHMKDQLKRLGISYAWEREFATCDREYYKWNQWLFLKMFERGLAYRKKSSVNWCPSCQTVLANEQVIDGACWRCVTEVNTRDLEQWFFRITEYADELLYGTEDLRQWPDKVLTMQRNWIGRSEGSLVKFKVSDSDDSIEVFTTRLDTIFGATFVLLAPEHPLVDSFAVESEDSVRFGERLEKFRALDRTARSTGQIDKEGFDTEKFAVNPFTGERIPIWVANFVLVDYGTGAIMAVPAHDQRDFEFARKYGLAIRVVIQPSGSSETSGESLESAVTEHGLVVDSGDFSGATSAEARRSMMDVAETQGSGKSHVQYRLRDWGISRQRYWGTPIPIVYCDVCGVQAVPLNDLPVELPPIDEFTGRGDSPLAQLSDFVQVSCPKCGKDARRETDTMDTFVDSSWYFYRYCDPHNEVSPFDVAKVKYWAPIDFYSGGVEHAILHLIYSRFFCKVLRDLGMVEHDEPFIRLLTQGMVLKDGAVMSKSKGNVVDPDEMTETFGADSLRLYEMFVAPPEKEIEWTDSGLEGSARFLGRVWRLVLPFAPVIAAGEIPSIDELRLNNDERSLRRKTHQTIRRVSEDIDPRVHLNTAVSGLMELVNALYAFCEKTRLGPYHVPSEEADATTRDRQHAVIKEGIESLVLMLSPFTPHLAEELWEEMGYVDALEYAEWPNCDPEVAQEDELMVPVQVNGKVRARVLVSLNISEDELKQTALTLPQIQTYTANKEVKRVVVVPRKMVSIVVK